MSAKSDESLAANTSLYREFLAEREEILKHKWIQSEEAGHDVGLETALVDWALHHRTSWKQEPRALSRS
jgi:hypothetical protein